MKLERYGLHREGECSVQEQVDIYAERKEMILQHLHTLMLVNVVVDILFTF